ncbi:MAG TPA: acyl-CoA thioesterase/BAAT N-terminal domain-containing protein [Longimicrobiaceae bacterium]|nr:acyl-CoA thioesterase/BAAT N-terminal domain-containing protein [Longimicrobiaceae bacterium]
MRACRSARLLHLASCAFLVSAAACASAAPASRAGPRLVIAPESAQVDEPIRIRAEGLAPGTPVEVVLRWPGAPGGVLRSNARVHADRNGRIDLGVQKPDAASYPGVDANGLLWSLAA